MNKFLEQLNGGLIVSCQPVDNGPLDKPDIVARFALAALAGGANGLRVEGHANLKAVREVTDTTIIGLIKTDRSDSPVRITSTIEDVDALAEIGADIIAFDATSRHRPVPRAELVNRIHSHGKLAMADCSCVSDGRDAIKLGCEILGSTMSGYVGQRVPDQPDLELVTSLAGLGRFILAEGRYNTPELARQAIHAGANAVVVGSAVTRPEHITSWFAESVRTARNDKGCE